MGVIFDLDQTLIDSKIAEKERKNGNWKTVYSLIPKFKVYDGIKETIHFLKDREIQIAIVSTSPRSYCQKVLSGWDLFHNHIIAYHDTTKKKPFPDPMLKALELMKEKSSEVISFGDRLIDLESSRSAQIKCIGCTWDSNDDLSSFKPDFLIKKPIEIIPLVKEFFNIKK
ncbi:MAG: NIF family HAD-type phosphatase [Cyclobacteriaceae bacterium]